MEPVYSPPPEDVPESQLQRLEDFARDVASIDRYARVMDTYGLDVIIGLIPALGDSASALVSTLIFLFFALKHEFAFSDVLKILFVFFIDFLIGSIPLIGDIVDYFIKSNVRARNRIVEIFEERLRKADREQKISGSDFHRLRGIARLDVIDV